MTTQEVQETLKHAKYAIENGTHYSKKDLEQFEQLTMEVDTIYRILKARFGV